MNPPHVSQMANNQYWITTDDGWEIFQSYSTTVAMKKTSSIGDYCVYLHADYWNMYSATTNKYLLRFLENVDSIQEVRQIVKDGGYTVVSGWWEVEE